MNNLALEITSKAYDDIDKIAEYIRQDNKTAAQKHVELFFDAFGMLCKHPNIGKE